MSSLVCINTSLSKICHAKPGMKVRLPDPKTGEVRPEVFMVVVKPEKGRRAARKNMTQGLYDDERDLFLVSMETGELREMPHLSSRADLIREKEIETGVLPVLKRLPLAVRVTTSRKQHKGKREKGSLVFSPSDPIDFINTMISVSGARIDAVELIDTSLEE